MSWRRDFYPFFFILLMPIYIVNIVLYYRDKSKVNYYFTAISEFSKCMTVAQALSKEEKVKACFSDLDFINDAKKIERKTRFLRFGSSQGNDLLILVDAIVELLKIAFNVELIIFHHFIDDIIAKQETIDKLFCFIGEIDAAISVANLRLEDTPSSKPDFTEDHALRVENIVHPLIVDCVPNSLTLEHSSLLLTGSNMSGKTTFIRTVCVNSILAQTIYTTFSKSYQAPFFKLYSSIRISDNLEESTSYYLKEVLIIKEFISASHNDTPCLFVLDEILKGTNTVERIAAGKAILSYLNRKNHIVLVSTHDMELTDLLEKSNYALYHFCENIDNNMLVFNYLLKKGVLNTKNAIKILEIYGYPPEIIADAKNTQDCLT